MNRAELAELLCRHEVRCASMRADLAELQGTWRVLRGRCDVALRGMDEALAWSREVLNIPAEDRLLESGIKFRFMPALEYFLRLQTELSEILAYQREEENR